MYWLPDRSITGHVFVDRLVDIHSMRYYCITAFGPFLPCWADESIIGILCHSNIVLMLQPSLFILCIQHPAHLLIISSLCSRFNSFFRTHTHTHTHAHRQIPLDCFLVQLQLYVNFGLSYETMEVFLSPTVRLCL